MSDRVAEAIPRKRGGDPKCPPGYPYCGGCGEVFDAIEDIPDHDCPEASEDRGNMGDLFG